MATDQQTHKHSLTDTYMYSEHIGNSVRLNAAHINRNFVVFQFSRI